MAAFLFGEATAQRFQELVEAAHRLDQPLLLLGEIFFHQLFQPFGGDFGGKCLLQKFHALEHLAEHPVELVEIALVLHQRGAGEVVEILDAARGEILLHRLQQGQIFAQGHRHAGGLELLEKADEHGRLRPKLSAEPAAGSRERSPHGAKRNAG